MHWSQETSLSFFYHCSFSSFSLSCFGAGGERWWIAISKSFSQVVSSAAEHPICIFQVPYGSNYPHAPLYCSNITAYSTWIWGVFVLHWHLPGDIRILCQSEHSKSHFLLCHWDQTVMEKTSDKAQKDVHFWYSMIILISYLFVVSIDYAFSDSCWTKFVLWCFALIKL